MANERKAITKRTVDAAKPKKGEGAEAYIIWDTDISGFGLKVTPILDESRPDRGGSKVYFYRYRPAWKEPGQASKMYPRTYTIGKHGNLTPDDARTEAKRLAALVERKIDPLEQEENDAAAKAELEQRFTVADVLDNFIKEHVEPNLSDMSEREYRRLAEKVLKPALGSKPVDDLTPVDVAAMRDQMKSKPTTAAYAVRVLSSALSWAEEAGQRAHGPNPARIKLKTTRRRERLFSDAEVARLLAKIGELEADGAITKVAALGLRLLFATGCRAGEICGLEWSNVDFDEGLLRWPNSKTGFLLKPLTAEARKLLKGAGRIVGCNYVCPSSKLKALRVDTLEAGFEKVMVAAHVEAREKASLHLIRHWFATRTYTNKDIPLPVQMAILGHSSVATAMRYAHVSNDELKAAAEAAAKGRAKSVRAASKRGKVVELRKRSA